MLAYADVCCVYADVCWRMLTYADPQDLKALRHDCALSSYADVCWRMLTYAGVYSYAGVCWRMLTYADPQDLKALRHDRALNPGRVAPHLGTTIYVSCRKPETLNPKP